MQFTVIGNSLTRGMVIEGFEIECRPGARLRELLGRARERAGANRLVLVIFGIPDLRDEGLVRQIREVREEEGIVLCPFYPPRGASTQIVRKVEECNIHVREWNRRNGYGTPNLVAHMFHRRDGRMILEERFLQRDGVHWTVQGRRLAEAAMREWARIHSRGIVERAREDCRRKREEMERKIRELREECERDCERIMRDAEERESRRMRGVRGRVQDRLGRRMGRGRRLALLLGEEV